MRRSLNLVTDYLSCVFRPLPLLQSRIHAESHAAPSDPGRFLPDPESASELFSAKSVQTVSCRTCTLAHLVSRMQARRESAPLCAFEFAKFAHDTLIVRVLFAQPPSSRLIEGMSFVYITQEHRSVQEALTQSSSALEVPPPPST